MYYDMFTAKLKKARLEQGLTQRDISKLLNISQPTYSGYESGRTQPDLETLGQLCDFLGVSADWLLGTKGGK